MHKRHRMIGASIACIGIVTLLLVFAMYAYTVYRGKDVMSLRFLLEKPAGVPLGTNGGIFPALVGSIYLGGISGVIGGALGIMTALYLVFYPRQGIIQKAVRTAILGLSGIPSILYGLMGYTFLIYNLKMQRSLLTASLTVAAMIIPFVTIRAEKIFRERSEEYTKEAHSLGLNTEFIVQNIVLPDTFPACIATVALAMTYGIGAVAPILYTGVVMQADVPKQLADPFMSLPYHLYMLVTSGYSQDYAYATALVLILFVFIVHSISKFIVLRKEKANAR